MTGKPVNEDNNQDPFLTFSEAADYLNVPHGYLRWLVAEKRVASVKFGPGRGSSIRFRRSDLDALIGSRRSEVGESEAEPL